MSLLGLLGQLKPVRTLKPLMPVGRETEYMPSLQVEQIRDTHKGCLYTWRQTMLDDVLLRNDVTQHSNPYISALAEKQVSEAGGNYVNSY